MSSIIDINFSGATERRAVLKSLNINDLEKNYVIIFEEQFLIDGEIVSRKRHSILEDGETWDKWDETIGSQIRPLIEEDMKKYFEKIKG